MNFDQAKLLVSHIFLFLCLCLNALVDAVPPYQEKNIHYRLTDDPIDVVIVTHPKDKKNLSSCIRGIRKNCSNIRRIIIVSSEKLSDQAEWFDEKNFPFNIDDIALAIGKGSKAEAEKFFRFHNRGPGWYYQQCLKCYSLFVIPDISPNVLIVDADLVFLNPVKFQNESFGGLFCVSQITPKKLYINHAERLVPGYKRIYPNHYSVCHHMLFQRAIMEDLFRVVEHHHHMPFWKAFCNCVVFNRKKGASEYEIYYNFALQHTKQVEIRELKWINSGNPKLENQFRMQGYHFVAFQSYLIEKHIPVGKVGHN